MNQKQKNLQRLDIGIIDADTEELIDIASGEVVKANILSVVKGENGNPGKIQGSIEGQNTIGTIYKNSPYGIYGHLKNTASLLVDKKNLLPIALRNEIKTGDATLLTTLDNGKTMSYDIKIQKIYINNNLDNKSMVIRITDKKLLEKTGGIVQGMSGSPIIQNGKLVGALTHVMVNDVSMGYAVFAEIMVKNALE